MKHKVQGKGEDGVVDAIVKKAYERLGRYLKGETEYLAGRIAALNRRACLYKGKPCAVRARSEITGMVSVLSALGWEVECDWDRYDSGVDIVPVEIIAEEEGGEG